jgi:hypothetical protein
VSHRQRHVAVLVSTVLVAGTVAALPTAHAGAKANANAYPRIVVLSGRADLVSGASALVAITLPSHADAHGLTVRIGHRNVTHRFAFRSDGRFEGLLTHLHRGQNPVQAVLANGNGARLTLTDYPDSGPMFSGPQLKPWVCEQGARNKTCAMAPSYSYSYKSTDPAGVGLQSYDPSNPASDVATTTTDNGHKVPFIVRTETGYMDRDQYQISALYQPGKKWKAVAPQPQFDHKLLITHGASCGDDRTTGSAPTTTGDAAGDIALGMGYIVMSTALDNSGHNCNVALQAESLVMAKNRVETKYGTLRFTIGTGCSGGSLAQQWIANAYPGIYQGILPTCSFPDAYSTATQFLDYHLLLAYFLDPSRWSIGSGAVWSPTQMGDVLGGADGVANAKVSDTAQFHVAVPTDACSGVTTAQRYNAKTNPGGVRCTIQDAAVNVFGPEPRKLWSKVEHKIGHGFVRIPVDNVGVQYGLSSLRSGAITAAQFVDLNAKVGGVNIDTNPTTHRISAAGSPSLARAYRSGMINEANNLGSTAIIDCRGPNPGVFHDAYRAFAVRARLDRENGTHANQAIWEGAAPLLGDVNCEKNSFLAMDGWLRAVTRDHSGASVAHKVIHDKPSDITDRCYDGAGQLLTSTLCPAGVVNVEKTPRMVAGDGITTDDNKCRLQPLKRASYGSVTFSKPQWAQLKKTFPRGVCNFAKPGIKQQATVPWLTYQNAKGKVIYGGKPLGAAPKSQTFHARPAA